MAVNVFNVWEFGDYLDRMEEMDQVEIEIAIPRQRRYLRDMEDPTVFYTDIQFKSRYRFNKATVLAMMDDLHITEHLHRDTRQGLPLPPLIQFVCALRFYATGSFQTVLGDLSRVHQSTVSRSLHRITALIAQQLRDYVKFPDNEGMVANQAAFYNERHFPGVAGIIDGTHIPIQNPGGNIGEVYRNRKRYFSLNVQIVCGPRLEILDIVARWPGSAHDARIFDNSAVRGKFEAGQLRGCLIGDSAYPATPYLLTPLLVTRTPAEDRYNNTHKFVRNKIECCIGVLKRRLLCLKKGLAYTPQKVCSFVCACAVLHNVAVKMNDPVPEDGDVREQVVPVPHVAQPQHGRGAAFRRAFIARHFE